MEFIGPENSRLQVAALSSGISIEQRILYLNCLFFFFMEDF